MHHYMCSFLQMVLLAISYYRHAQLAELRLVDLYYHTIESNWSYPRIYHLSVFALVALLHHFVALF